ncbi:MAG: Carboxypeptidase regulatory-like protein [Acidobacteriaceae bacterium]|nr:Carboxypeptidase regulatory-like protein [Acidobacteriaceae bacterium]
MLQSSLFLKVHGRRFLLVVGLFVITLFFGSFAHAQVGANLSGVVKDTSGAAIPGASVVITNLSNGGLHRMTTGAAGEYRAVNLPPAKYSIVAQASGFGTTKKTVELIVGSELTTDVDLGTAGTSEVISVEAGGADALVETTKSQPSAVIDSRQLAALPVLNRSFLAIAQTMPGVAPIGAMSVNTKFAISKFGGVADQRNGYTTIIDGTPLDDSTWGTPIINISQDAIQEFKLYSHQFDAQYGHALNAVVNVVTLAGGDKYHGTAYYFGRNKAINATPALVTVKPPYSLLRTGATAGGPVPKLSQTHIFGSFEYLRINSAQITALPTSNPFSGQQNGSYPWTQWENIADVKLDHTFNENHRAYGRYAYDHQFLPNGGPTNSATSTTDNSIAHSLVFEDNYVLSPRLVNTARYAYLSHNLFSTPANFDIEVVRPSYSFGQNPTLPQYFPRTNHTISDTVFFSTAKHQIKVGAELAKIYSTYQSHYYEHGQFNFTTDVPFDINNTATYPQSFVMQSTGEYFYRQLQYTGFIQDDYKLLPNLTINAGFRYDFNSNLRNNKFYNGLLANSFFSGINNFVSSDRGTDWAGGLQPRVGFAYDVDGKGKLVLRGGFGMYYTRMRPYWGLQDQTQTLGAAVRITDQTALKNYPNITAVLGGRTLDQYVATGGARAANILDNKFSLPYSMNFTGGIGWQIDSKSSLNLTFVHDHSAKEIGTHDVNLPATGVVTAPAGTTVTAANMASRPVARFSTVGSVFNNGQSRYDALELQYRARPKYLETLVVSYAYSRSIINAVTYYSTYVGTQRTPQNYSYNPTDTPHNLSISMASREIRGGFRISTIFRGLSGSPVATNAGIDLDGDSTVTGDRPRGLPQFVGRGDIDGQLVLINAYRANPCGFLYFTTTACTLAKTTTQITRDQLLPDATLTWDARITKTFHFGDHLVLEGFFEGFNLGNHPTRYAPNAAMNSAAYMQPTAALDPRQLQWGARFRY